jgi:hypothetical protein
MMPRTIGDTVPDRLSFTFTPLNRQDAEAAMLNKEFPNVANLINTALRFYFENRDKSTPIDQFKIWLVSSEGETYMKDVMRKARDDSKKD